MPIWKARAEPKCRFFAWALLHKKILTANNLIKRNWPNDPICKLCGVDPENPAHCARVVPSQNKYGPSWKLGLGSQQSTQWETNGSLHGYWRRCKLRIDKPHRRNFDGLMIYFWWNIWKREKYKNFPKQKLAAKGGGILMQGGDRSIPIGHKTKCRSSSVAYIFLCSLSL